MAIECVLYQQFAQYEERKQSAKCTYGWRNKRTGSQNWYLQIVRYKEGI